MQIIVNGQDRLVQPGATVADLVAALALAGRRIAVELNGEIVPKSSHATRSLGEGDRVEIVVAVGGG
ncbi:MAG TPA: sulfur carrier protein ThiS [Rhodocyclaceae bacterium]